MAGSRPCAAGCTCRKHLRAHTPAEREQAREAGNRRRRANYVRNGERKRAEVNAQRAGLWAQYAPLVVEAKGTTCADCGSTFSPERAARGVAPHFFPEENFARISRPSGIEESRMTQRPCRACGEDQPPDRRQHHLISGVTHRHLPGVASGAKRRAAGRRRKQ